MDSLRQRARVASRPRAAPRLPQRGGARGGRSPSERGGAPGGRLGRGPGSWPPGAYNTRVAECAEALAAARRLGHSARSLRDLSPEDLPALAPAVSATVWRRARHVVHENARVDAVCRALEAGDPGTAGALLQEGMRSLREDYEVSTPELDRLCRTADRLPGVHGSRLTGAGWGGCTLHLVDPAAIESVRSALEEDFESAFGRKPPLWILHPAPGANTIPLS